MNYWLVNQYVKKSLVVTTFYTTQKHISDSIIAMYIVNNLCFCVFELHNFIF